MTSPFKAIADMAAELPDIAQQDHFYQVLTLDDWVHIYRLCYAATALGAVAQPELAGELEKHGIFGLCRDLARRVVATEFGIDAGAQLHDVTDQIFNITAHLQQGLLNALTPTIMLAAR